MDSDALQKNCQLVSRAIAGMIRHSIREEAFREKCFNLLQVTNSNDAELELQRKLRQCALRHRHSVAVPFNLQEANASGVSLPKISNTNSVTNSKISDPHMMNKAANKENVSTINGSSSGLKSVMQKTSVQHKENFQAKYHTTMDLLELESSLEWDSTSTQRCSTQEFPQQDTSTLQYCTNSTYNENINWFQPDSRELEW